MYGKSRLGLQVLLALLHVAIFTSALSPPSRSLRRAGLPRNGGLTRRQAPSINGRDYPASWTTLPVDHFNASDTRTFQARYWYNSTFYEPGGPVFWYDVGESNAEDYVPHQLAQTAGPSAIMTMARRFKGLALVVEHRYYGRIDEGSFPFPVNQSTGSLIDQTNYKYLTSEQALADAVYFANHFDLQLPGLSSGGNGSSPLSPGATPWVWIGGSYPGVRGASLRVRNPETFYAAWASSAPTQTEVDMWTYYAQVERGLARNCSADFTAVTRYVDGVLANGTAGEVAALKREMMEAVLASPEVPAPVITDKDLDDCDNPCVGYNLTLPFTYYQYYGPGYLVAPFCDILETQNRTDVSTTDNGGLAKALAPASGLALEFDITTAWNAFLVALKETNYDAIEYEPDLVGDASYMWQWCAEWGFYPRGNPDNPHTIISQFLSLEYYQSFCDETYPGLAPPTPNVSITNQYGGWNMQPSNIMWTTGQIDPWRALEPSSIEEGSPGRWTTQVIPACNQPPAGNDLFGMIYQGMGHATDLRYTLLNETDPNGQFTPEGRRELENPESYFAGTALFERALEQWLPCFVAK